MGWEERKRWGCQREGEGKENASIILLEEVFYFNNGKFVYLLGVSLLDWMRQGHGSSFPPRSFRI